MPYAFFEALPGFSGFRVPSRAGVTAALALSVVAMLVLQKAMMRYRYAPWPAILTIGTLLIFVNNLVEWPMRATAIEIPAIYETVAADPAPTALLDTGARIFEFEIRLVFLLFQLHERTHMAQLSLNSVRGSKDKVLVSQRDRDLNALGFDN